MTEPGAAQSLQRMVVFPALSRPRIKMRTSLLPNKEENTLLKSMPIVERGSCVPVQLALSLLCGLAFCWAAAVEVPQVTVSTE